MSFSHVTILGNLVRDVELKYTQGNLAIAELSIAVNEKWTTDTGEKKERVSYIDCTAFGKKGEAMAKYLGKGRPVIVIGRLQQETWVDKQTGGNRTKLKVVVETFHFVGPKQDKDDGYAASPDVTPVEVKRKSPAPAKTTGGTDYMPIDDSDLPF